MSPGFARYAEKGDRGTIHRIRPHRETIDIERADISAYCGYTLQEGDKLKEEGEVTCDKCEEIFER